jgi:NADPH-ferrihemoprotein reductase
MIFYGTETGNAQGFATIAEGEAAAHGFQPFVVDLEQFVPEMLTGDLSGCDDDTKARVGPMIAPGGPLAMFFMATCGDGDATANALSFFSWINGEDGFDDASRDLSKLRFGVFALGNTSYEHFNAAGKNTQAGLEKLGATSVVELGLGDDNGELEPQCEDWRLLAWPGLQKATASDVGGGVSVATPSAAEADDEDAWKKAIPAQSLAPYSLVLLEPPSRVSAADTARDDLRASGAEEAADAAEEAAGGGAGPAVPASPSRSSWLHAEPLRLLSRNQLLAMGRGADPVRAKWFEAVPVRVTACREVRQAPSPGASTVHVELDVGSASLPYGTAHNSSILPENSPKQVQDLCAWLGLEPSQWFTIEGDAFAAALARSATAAGVSVSALGKATSLPAGQKPVPFPVPCTIGHALMRYCDLGGQATKACAGQLAHYAKSEREQRRLAHLVSVEGRANWEAWVRKPRRSVLELFQAFPSISIPPNQLLHILPPLKPREYTIASSALAHPGSMHLAVSVLEEAKPAADAKDGPDRRLAGVCSNYLAGLETAADGSAGRPIARVTVRSSAFNLPADPTTPVVMVGPGTGLAPMRAFCQEREAKMAAGEALGEALLFFGCRRSDEDFIYKEELEAWASSGVLTELHTAFSREASSGAKVYVQHRLKEQGARVWELIKEGGAHVYVCGATAMGSEVLSALATIAATEGGLTETEALAFVQDLEHEHRLVQELWA